MYFSRNNDKVSRNNRKFGGIISIFRGIQVREDLARRGIIFCFLKKMPSGKPEGICGNLFKESH